MHQAAEADAYTKLIDITSFPDMGGEPEMIDVTTLSQNSRSYIPGVQGGEGLVFEANYELADYQALKALDGSDEQYALWLGGTEEGGVVTPDGSDGKFAFRGQLSVYLMGGEVNAAQKMQITIAPSTPIAIDET